MNSATTRRRMSTVQLEDGTLVTSYSYRGADDRTHLEVVRWKLPAARSEKGPTGVCRRSVTPTSRSQNPDARPA
jgi:hypothetical protein